VGGLTATLTTGKFSGYEWYLVHVNICKKIASEISYLQKTVHSSIILEESIARSE